MANLPIKSHSVSKPFIQISVQYIVWNICNCPFHPFDEDLSLTSVKVKLHKFVFAWRDFPEEFFCNLAPENSWFVDGMVIHFLVSIHTGHMRLRFDLFRWVKPSHQLLFVLISVCWNYVVHDGVEILPLWEMDTNLLNGEGVRQFSLLFFFSGPNEHADTVFYSWELHVDLSVWFLMNFRFANMCWELSDFLRSDFCKFQSWSRTCSSECSRMHDLHLVQRSL